MTEHFWGRETHPPLILVADDDPSRLQALTGMITPHNEGDWRIATAMNGRRTLDKLRELRPDLLIADGALPGLDDPDIWGATRHLAQTDGFSILLIRDEPPSHDFFDRFAGRAVDLIAKPVHKRDLLARCRLHLSLKYHKTRLAHCQEQLEVEIGDRLRLAGENAELTAQIAEQTETIRRMATTDPLTGVYNYRAIMDHLAKKIAEAKRYRHSLTVILMDIDHLKAINADHGHPVGDHVLAEVAEMIRVQVREVDLVSRYSGQEFLIVLPHTPIEGGYKTAIRIQEAVAGYPWSPPGLAVTISGGVSTLKGEISEPRIRAETLLYRLIKQADDLLYRAKASGRNRVERD